MQSHPSNPQPAHATIKCGNCDKRICNRYCKIFCDNCFEFFHYKCSIKIKDFEILESQNIGWTCSPCRREIFPFNNVETNEEFSNIFAEDNLRELILQRKRKCNSCSKAIKKHFPANCCLECKKYFHLKCSEIPKRNAHIPKDWVCSKCSISFLPFASMDKNALLLTLDGLDDKVIDSLNNVPNFSMKSLLDKMPGQRFSTDEFIGDNITSKYLTPGEFLREKTPRNNFSIFHLNIASLQKHIEELRSLIYNLKHNFKMICISETRLHESQTLVNVEIDGYKFVHIPTKTQCGGVGMYISHEYEFEIIDDFSLSHDNICESIFVELKIPTKKNLVVGTIYRHHTPVNEFLDIFLRKFLKKLTQSSKSCIFAGDFNIDLTQYGIKTMVDDFFEEVTSFSFRPLILQPTRVTSNSFTLIDNIFTNDISCLSSGGNIITSISDHFSQFCNLDIFHNFVKTQPIKFSRDWKNFNRQRFAYELSKLSWDDVTCEHLNTNTSIKNFYNNVTELLDEMAPIKRLTKKERGLIERPWITIGILNSIKSRDQCYKNFLKETDPILKKSIYESYKLKRNLLITLLRQSKKDYYINYFLENQSNLKKTWEGIRKLINVTKKNDVYIDKINKDNIDITSHDKIAECMNSFFVSMGMTVENKIPKTDKYFSSYLNHPNNCVITLNICSINEIKALISKLEVSKASGPFSIPTKLLKLFNDVFAIPLTSIVNKSLSEGIFPDLLKSANVHPIFKKNDKTKCSNYRPISLLSNLSKIFERVMYNRIELFLNDFDLIYKNQFGFRKKHSTSHALISIVEQIRNNLDNQIFSCAVFVDLEKAFDTVNHDILISKLDYYGISGKANAWIRSYLSFRNQSVTVNGTTSSKRPITCGVPQGSILGPLLFLIYINDLNEALLNCSVFHFADDTNLLFSNKNPDHLHTAINQELNLLFEWLCSNRLSLNVSKTEFIIFRPPKKYLINRVTLKLNGVKLFESPKIKYLGIILDSRLTWKHHTHELCKKLSRSVGIIYKVRHYCSAQVLRSLYFSLFNSHLAYGLSIWGNCNSIYSEKLKVLQKKFIRAISFSDFNAPSAPIFKDLKILSFDDLYKSQIGSLMWDYDHGNLPDSLSKLFKRRSSMHQIGLRNALDGRLYTASKCNTNYGKKSFSQTGSEFLNKLKDSEVYIYDNSKTVFMKNLKKSLLDNY